MGHGLDPVLCANAPENACHVLLCRALRQSKCRANVFVRKAFSKQPEDVRLPCSQAGDRPNLLTGGPCRHIDRDRKIIEGENRLRQGLEGAAVIPDMLGLFRMDIGREGVERPSQASQPFA